MHHTSTTCHTAVVCHVIQTLNVCIVAILETLHELTRYSFNLQLN